MVADECTGWRANGGVGPREAAGESHALRTGGGQCHHDPVGHAAQPTMGNTRPTTRRLCSSSAAAAACGAPCARRSSTGHSARQSRVTGDSVRCVASGKGHREGSAHRLMKRRPTNGQLWNPHEVRMSDQSRFERSLPLDVSALPGARQQLRSFLNDFDLERDVVEAIILCVQEACKNASASAAAPEASNCR